MDRFNHVVWSIKQHIIILSFLFLFNKNRTEWSEFMYTLGLCSVEIHVAIWRPTLGYKFCRYHAFGFARSRPCTLAERQRPPELPRKSKLRLEKGNNYFSHWRIDWIEPGIYPDGGRRTEHPSSKLHNHNASRVRMNQTSQSSTTGFCVFHKFPARIYWAQGSQAGTMVTAPRFALLISLTKNRRVLVISPRSRTHIAWKLFHLNISLFSGCPIGTLWSSALTESCIVCARNCAPWKTFSLFRLVLLGIIWWLTSSPCFALLSRIQFFFWIRSWARMRGFLGEGPPKSQSWRLAVVFGLCEDYRSSYVFQLCLIGSERDWKVLSP